MTELCDIAEKYGTDKCPQLKHHFTEYYYEMLVDRRLKIRKVLEIGIGNIPPKFIPGASLLMWREWLPNALIYGVDIEKELMIEAPRIITLIGDQRSEEDMRCVLECTGTDLDLIVEDATHIKEDQIFTCRLLMELVDEKTIYVIEDCPKYEEVIADLEKDFLCEVKRPRHRRYKDDSMVVVRNK